MLVWLFGLVFYGEGCETFGCRWLLVAENRKVERSSRNIGGGLVGESCCKNSAADGAKFARCSSPNKYHKRKVSQKCPGENHGGSLGQDGTWDVSQKMSNFQMKNILDTRNSTLQFPDSNRSWNQNELLNHP